MNIYIDGLGYRNPIADKDQIIWYFNQISNTKGKGEATKYWLNLREWYAERLLTLEAYELLDFIKAKATDARMKRRKQFREKAKETSEKEMENLKIEQGWRTMVRSIINQIGRN